MRPLDRANNCNAFAFDGQRQHLRPSNFILLILRCHLKDRLRTRCRRSMGTMTQWPNIMHELTTVLGSRRRKYLKSSPCSLDEGYLLSIQGRTIFNVSSFTLASFKCDRQFRKYVLQHFMNLSLSFYGSYKHFHFVFCMRSN